MAARSRASRIVDLRGNNRGSFVGAFVAWLNGRWQIVVFESRHELKTAYILLSNPGLSRSGKIQAALLYFHGMRMGKTCLKTDYVKAITMLVEVGDTSDAASLLKVLDARANGGNPKAIAALNKLEKLGLIKSVKGQ